MPSARMLRVIMWSHFIVAIAATMTIATPIPSERVRTELDLLTSSLPSMALKQYQRSAPQAITPIIMPSSAPVVSAPSPPAASEPANPGNAKAEKEAGAQGEHPASEGPAGTNACAPKAPSSPSAEEQWIKIMGILVPAVVALALGISGFLVTIHVNSPKRRGKTDDDIE